jgi:hypothetical protein
MLKCAAPRSCIRTPIEEGRHGSDKWSRRPRQERLHKLMYRYQICVALDERFGPNDVSLDVRTDQQHPLLKHEMRIATSPNGNAVLVLTFTAVDLWAAILTGMALVRQSGYVPVAIQARAMTRRFRTERLVQTAHGNERQPGEFDD